MMGKRSVSRRRRVTLDELVSVQKKHNFTLPEYVMLTNNRPLGRMVAWEPSDSPEQITIELAPNYADKILMLSMTTDLIDRVEERTTEEGLEFFIWIDHHSLIQELGQNLSRKLLTGS